ncbi:MAG TPA: hypothetical protein PKG51_02535 [Arachnia sp.]|nr:hypothetical protein [Arachnia sp.]
MGQGSNVVGAGVGAQDRGDGLHGLGGDVFGVIDGDLGEQCPVEHPAFGGFGFGVEVSQVGEDVEDRVESDLRVGVEGAE